MTSSVEPIISDSEPEYATELSQPTLASAAAAAAAPAANRSSRRRTSDERPGMSTGEAEGREVLVLSSEDEGAARVTSSYFAAANAPTKRRKRPSPGAQDDWPFEGLAGLERPRSGSSASPGAAAALRGRSTSAEIPRQVSSLAARPGPTRPIAPSGASGASSDSPGRDYDSAASSSSAQPAPPSFVSARQLLRDSGTPALPPDADDDLIPPAQLGQAHSSKPALKPRKKKPRAASIESQFSVEVVESAPQRATSANKLEPAKPPPRRRRAVVDAASGDDAPASGASSSGSLVPPSEWKEQFKHGAASSSNRPAAVKRDDSQEPSASARRKPWEALESQPVKTRGKKKEPNKRAPTVKKSVKAEIVEVDELDSDGDDVVVPSARPAPTASSKPRQTSLSHLPTPIALPSDKRIRLLTACPLPLCLSSWPATLLARQNHLRACAKKLDLAASTVSELADSQILNLADAADDARRVQEESRTLFDAAIGRGQGAAARSDVHVVGVEGFAGEDPGEWYRATKMVQDELDLARKKESTAKDVKLARVAQEIRRERAEAAARGETAGWDVVPKGGAVEGDPGGGFELPPATGRLRAETSTARAAVVERASALLGSTTATGAVDSDGDDVLSLAPTLVADEDEYRHSSFNCTPPRPTQELEPTVFSTGSDPDSSLEVLVQRSKPSIRGAADGRSRSPFRGLLLQDPCGNSESPEGPHRQHRSPRRHSTTAGARDSLWRAAAGRDDASLKVVMESPRTSSATEGMRTLGLRSAERGSLPVEQDDESLWRDFDSGDDLVLIGGAEVASVSSDEEPLSSVVRRSSTGRARHHQPASTPTRSLYLDTDSPLPTPPGPRRRTDQPAASSTTHAPRASPPAAPDYSSHSVAALQREVAKYGFRPSKERAVLERQLGDVWRALHCNGAPSAEAGEEEEVVEPEEKKKKTRGRKKKGVPPGEDGEEQQEEEDTETVGEKLRRLVLADEALYLRVLRYEPIHFDEFVALAAQGGVKVAKPLLVRFLDEQSITFYTQDPTGGTRRRYR